MSNLALQDKWKGNSKHSTGSAERGHFDSISVCEVPVSLTKLGVHLAKEEVIEEGHVVNFVVLWGR